MVCWTRASVSRSTAAVASSRIRTWVLTVPWWKDEIKQTIKQSPCEANKLTLSNTQVLTTLCNLSHCLLLLLSLLFQPGAGGLQAGTQLGAPGEPSGELSTTGQQICGASQSWTQTSESGYLSKGSRFNLRLPENKTGSCGKRWLQHQDSTL